MRGKRAILRKFYVCGGISEVRVIFRYVFFTDFLTGGRDKGAKEVPLKTLRFMKDSQS